jgi:hypothetical protein
MNPRNIRRLIVIIIFLLSLSILVWSIWPFEETTQVLPISPEDMQLPTPGIYLPFFSSFFTA